MKLFAQKPVFVLYLKVAIVYQVNLIHQPNNYRSIHQSLNRSVPHPIIQSSWNRAIMQSCNRAIVQSISRHCLPAFRV